MWHLQIRKLRSILFVKSYLIFTTLIHNCYWNKRRNPQISIPIEFFLFLENIKEEWRKFKILYICLVWQETKRTLANFSIFFFASDPPAITQNWSLLGPSFLLLLRVCKADNYFPTMWHSLHLKAQKNLPCSDIPSRFLSFE